MTNELSQPACEEGEVRRLIESAEQSLEAGAFREAHAACITVLKHAPRTPDAFHLLGVLTAEHDNHAKAVELFDRALALDDADARYHAWRGRSLIALNRRADAVAAARRAAACDDLSAQTLDTIGVIYTRAGLHEDAVTFYRRATKADETRPDYWYNLGASEQFAGRMDEARRAYRKTIHLEPTHVRAWSALIGVTRQTKQENDIPALKALFADLTDADRQLHIGHALAKAYEDLGDQNQAMHWLARAKANKRGHVVYDPSATANLFSAATQTAHADVSATGDPDEAPVFVVGLPRTGTTLVDRILSSHADVESVGELTDFALAVKQAADTHSQFVLDTETLEAAAHADMKQIGADYLRSARRVAPHALRFVDKMPLNFFYAALIHRALPNARIICVRRHPADSVLSNYRQLFATSFSYYNYAYDLEWAADYYVAFDTLVRRFRNTLPSDRFLECAYEEIVDGLEPQARRLVAFCGLDWDPACLAFHQNAAPVATASSVQVRRPIYSSSVGRWRSCIDAMEPALARLRDAGVMPSEPQD